MKNSQITSHYEVNGLPSEELDRYERKLVKSDSVYTVVEIIYHMYCDLMKAINVREPKQINEKTLSVKTNPKDMFLDSSEVRPC